MIGSERFEIAFLFILVISEEIVYCMPPLALKPARQLQYSMEYQE